MIGDLFKWRLMTEKMNASSFLIIAVTYLYYAELANWLKDLPTSIYENQSPEK